MNHKGVLFIKEFRDNTTIIDDVNWINPEYPIYMYLDSSPLCIKGGLLRKGKSGHYGFEIINSRTQKNSRTQDILL